MTGKDPKRWGPPTWRVLHQLARIADLCGLQTEFFRLLHAFRFMFPCGMCRVSYKRFIRVVQRDPSMQVMMYRLHNMVNTKLSVENPPSLEDAVYQHATRGFYVADFWAMVYFMAYNYYANGEANRLVRYVDFFTQLAEFFAAAHRACGVEEFQGLALAIAEHVPALPVMEELEDQDAVAAVFVEMQKSYDGHDVSFIDVVNRFG